MSEPIYECTYDIHSRFASRAGSWSTKHLREAFQKLGYEINGLQIDHPFLKQPKNTDKCLFQRICFSGTKAECLAIRKDLNATLRVLTNNRATPSFNFKII